MSPRRDAALVRSAPLFAALGDPTRLRVVARLSAEGPQSITELTADAGVTRQAVTKHLYVLHDAGLVRHSRLGRESVWELDPKRLEEARQAIERLSDRWDEALERLRRLVES
jgi:DNA-binding transcriptional ArsR family regulator